MMHKGSKTRSGRVSTAAVLALIFFAFGSLVRASAPPQEPEQRADIIMIDDLKAFGDLERPAVPFLHSKHTEAVEKQNQDCKTCHIETEKGLSYKFKRTADADKATAMQIYHDECIACHKSTAESSREAGPVACGDCHRQNDKMNLVSNWQAIDLDSSLHYRHVKANDKKCELCHHEYDKDAKKLFYAKGKEGACVYCHQAQSVENRISNQLASHQACITCHRQRLAQNRSAGPVNCLGCHDPVEQQMIEKVTDVPRLERNQPDVVLVKSAHQPSTPNDLMGRMQSVPFDHKAHERYNNSCKVCHHAALDACVSCHSLEGQKEGNFIKLERAMHILDKNASCVGCHSRQQAAAECAGCHKSIPQQVPMPEDTCRVCHRGLVPRDLAPLDADMRTMIAGELLQSRPRVSGTYAEKDIPEKVAIKTLVDQFDAVSLPHRKIVLKLAQNIKENPLAGYFHRDPGTLCQGCHHRSPESLKPPACNSCHGTVREIKEADKPILTAAYHQQCMSCHQAMGIQKPDSRDCTACHKKRING